MRQVFFISMILLSGFLPAQEKSWTLDDCIRYAIEHNTVIKKQEAQNRIYGIDKQESIAGFFPSINVESSIYSNFGRSIDPETNTYISMNTFSNTYEIRASVTLFNGLANVYQAKLARINRLKGKEQLLDAQNRIALETMEVFFNALYYKGTVELAENQLQESADALKRIKRMEELGLKSATDVAEIRAKEAEDHFLLTRQQNLFNSEIIRLKTKINLPVDEELAIAATPQAETVYATQDNPLKIFEQAQFTLPQLRASEQAFMASKTEYKIARGRLFPGISAGAGFSTGFSRLMDGSKYMSFSEQLKNRQGSYVGLALSIPLFDRLSGISGTKRAKQRMIIAGNEREELMRQIYSEIEQAVADVRGLLDESRSAHEKTEAMLEAHKVNTRKYDEGLVNAIELATSANRLLNARVEELHINLKYQIKCKLLNYYKGETSWIEF